MAPVLAPRACQRLALVTSFGSALLVGGMVALIVAVAGCQGRTPAPMARQRPSIVAADGVLCDLTQRLVQSAAEVNCLVPPGEDPHSLRLTPQQKRQLGQAQVVLINGYNLSPSLQGLAGSKAVAELAVPDSPKLDPQSADPHVWQDPAQGQALVRWLHRELGALLPAEARAMDRRAKAMESVLADLDTWNRRQLATIPGQAAGQKPVLASSHRAFISLVRAYGLEELALLDGSSGSHVLRPEGLDATLKQLRRLGVRQLFSEELPPPKALLRLSALSGIPIAPAALVADGLAPGQPSLPATAIANTCLISEGLGGRCDRQSGQALQTRWLAIR